MIGLAIIGIFEETDSILNWKIWILQLILCGAICEFFYLMASSFVDLRPRFSLNFKVLNHFLEASSIKDVKI